MCLVRYGYSSELQEARTILERGIYTFNESDH